MTLYSILRASTDVEFMILYFHLDTHLNQAWLPTDTF